MWAGHSYLQSHGCMHVCMKPVLRAADAAAVDFYAPQNARMAGYIGMGIWVYGCMGIRVNTVLLLYR